MRGTTTKQIVELLRKAGAKRGPRPDQRAADLPPVLLRHRHLDRDRADRRDPHGARDPRVHRRRLARVSLDPGRAGGARPAVRAVLLRLLRRQLPGARPVRRRIAKVHAGGAGVSGGPCLTTPFRLSARRRRCRWPASGPSSSCATHVESTRRPESVGGLGGFGGAFAIPAGYREPLMIASTDGVGTKTVDRRRRPALRHDRHRPRRDVRRRRRVHRRRAAAPSSITSRSGGSIRSTSPSWSAGVAAGCREAGCALVGGETAEHPGVDGADEFDLAGLLHRRRGALARDRRQRRPRRRRHPRACPRPGCTRTASRWSGRSWRSGTSTWPSRTRNGCAARSATARAERAGGRARTRRSRHWARCC